MRAFYLAYYANKGFIYILLMLLLNKDDIEKNIIVTLKENITLETPYYFLFVCKHIETKKEIKFIKKYDDDISDYTNRYNEFTLNINTLFGSSPVGQYNYAVYQQKSNINMDVENTEGLLEKGKIILSSNTKFSYTSYNKETTYTAYSG